MPNQYLRRYTSLSVLLDILSNKKLTLLDPQSWEDKNDSYYLSLYKTKMGLKSVLALCFTEAGETYHHWKVFCGTSDGVCLQFEKDKLLECFDGITGIKKDNVTYKKIKEARSTRLTREKLPFLKRHPFKDEKEYRLIFESDLEELASKDVPISLSSISKIIFNPWIPKSVCNSVKMVIKEIDGCKKIRLSRTTLVDNEEWKKIGGKIT